MNFHELAAERYSCRKFSDREVPAELIEQIIDTALLAPTAVDKQPYRIFLMQSEDSREKLEQVTRFTFGAKVFLAVGCQKEAAWTRKFDGTNFAVVDASIVATHIMMEIAQLGLATTWVGYFDAPRLKELCPQMKEYEMIAVFPIGYAAEDAEPSPMHFERRPREQMVERL